MKRTLLLILSIFLLTAQAEEIDSPLVHADEMASAFVAVDISPTITFQTDEAGVFAVVVLSSSEELPTPDPSITPAPFVELGIVEVVEEMVEQDETAEEPAAFILSTRSTSRSLIYTLTPIGESP